MVSGAAAPEPATSHVGPIQPVARPLSSFPVRVSFTRGRLWLDDADHPREEPECGKAARSDLGGEAEWPSYPTIAVALTQQHL